MRHVRGLTLIEVLVAMVVLAIGLLGVAQLVALSLRQGRVASVEAHAVFVAESVRDRMASNLVGVWLDAYDAEITAAPGGAAGACEPGCGPAALAAFDRLELADELFHLLGSDARLTIACTPTGSVPVELPRSPPYEGRCDLGIAWREMSQDGTSESRNVHWRFLP